jgi:Tol biopolymer transport system component
MPRAAIPLLGLFIISACGPDEPLAPSTPARTVVIGAHANSSTGTVWLAPVNLGAGINTSAVELQVGVAPNGRTLYVTSGRPGTFGRQDIYVSHREGGSWGPLVNLGPLVNTAGMEVSPTVTVDGHYLYFSSDRPGGFGGFDCWRSYRKNVRDDFGWGAPQNLGSGVNTSMDEADCLIRRTLVGRQELWFASLNRPEGEGDWDIYRSDLGRDGVFRQAEPVSEINTEFRETRMTLTVDGRELIFTSNRPGGLGNIDFWVAKRWSPRGRFCEPVNLGPTVNSVDNDRSPSLTADGRRLYMTSTRPGGLGLDDVYVVRRQFSRGSTTCHLMSD